MSIKHASRTDRYSINNISQLLILAQIKDPEARRDYYKVATQHTSRAQGQKRSENSICRGPSHKNSIKAVIFWTPKIILSIK